jgi:UDP-2-acetamido-3-amino-2,3-dideoxy-glucuronate N-acetyltransferase
MKIHPLADVQTSQIGKDTVVWQFSIILSGARIGKNCNINCHTFIENNVVIGNNVTVKSGVYLWDGIEVEDDVFIGPNVTFTNDKYPRSKTYPPAYQNTILKKGCSVGANATILGGSVIGQYAIIGAGSVVTRSVPPYGLVKGNPASICGWLDERGNKLTKLDSEKYIDKAGQIYTIKNNNLIKQ